MAFGMPYTGSKNKIAKTILSNLPPGKRFVDLFGGGGAMTHCAALSGKYNSCLYNEVLPMIADTFRKATDGYFANTIPYWVSREDFFNLRETDGYACLCFSFSNNMENYIGNEKVEESSREEFFRRLGGKEKEVRCRPLESYQRLIKLSGLSEHCPLEITCGDYTEYENKSGDVVYCDPPYITKETESRLYRSDQNKRHRQNAFDYKKFLDWVDSRPYQVYVSGYEVPDDRFAMIREIPKTNVFKGANRLNSKVAMEILYTQRRYGRAENSHNTKAEQISMI